MDQNTVKYFSSLPYHFAALKGDLNVIKDIPTEHLNQRDERGLSPLQVAILSNHIKCAAFLIEKGADVNIQTTAILSSNDHQDKDRAKPIFNKITAPEWELMVPFDKKITALHLAAAFGYQTIVKLLIKHGAKINLRSNGGVSPLHYASLFGHSEIIHTLLKNKAKVNVKTKTQNIPGWFDAEMTVLHAAAQSGNHDSVKRLLEQGCAIQDYTKAGCGVIFFAARSNTSAVMKLFLELGAELQSPCPRFFNDPFQECILRANSDVVALLLEKAKQIDGISTTEGGRKVFLWQPPVRTAIRYQNIEIIQLLLNAGATRPTYQNVEQALFFGDLEKVKKFFSEGQKPEIVQITGHSTLYNAVAQGYAELVKFLLENGYQENISKQEVNSQDKLTPLHVAVMSIAGGTHPLEEELHRERSYLIAKTLLENGANPNAVDSFGRTSLELVRRNRKGKDKITKLLLQYGANKPTPN